QDAVTEIVYLTSRTYEWVVKGDIEACFDRIDHTAAMGRVRERIGDRKVLRLIKAFLRAGVMEAGLIRGQTTGAPQGGILFALLGQPSHWRFSTTTSRDAGPNWKLPSRPDGVSSSGA